ncbi:hypothetical protein EPO44_12150 [bacterium]|nr:MAG: hypothetical protein EPO44_12150 [bacterium]
MHQKYLMGFPAPPYFTDRITGERQRHHKDVSTTMIYTHILNRGGKGVHSPADQLGISSG